jgi:hypothetical protein
MPDDLKDFAAMDHGNAMNQASMIHDPSATADAPLNSRKPLNASAHRLPNSEVLAETSLIFSSRGLLNERRQGREHFRRLS